MRIAFVLVYVFCLANFYRMYWNTRTDIAPLVRDLRATTLVLQSFNDSRACASLCAAVHGRTGTVVVVEYGSAMHPCADAVYHLTNVGRDYRAFLWYVVQFYGVLSGTYVFASANLGKHRRAERIARLLNEDPTTLEFSCTGSKVDFGLPRIMTVAENERHDSNFTILHYKTAQGNADLAPATPRPLGRWIAAHVDADTRTWRASTACGQGVFRTSARLLRKHPKEYYENLLRQLEVDNAPESVHYAERATASIFGDGA